MAEDCCAGIDTIGARPDKFRSRRAWCSGPSRAYFRRQYGKSDSLVCLNHQSARSKSLAAARFTDPQTSVGIVQYGPEAGESTSSYCCDSGAWRRSADSNTSLSSSIPFSRSAMPHRTKSAAVSRNTSDSRRFFGCEIRVMSRNLKTRLPLECRIRVSFGTAMGRAPLIGWPKEFRGGSRCGRGTHHFRSTACGRKPYSCWQARCQHEKVERIYVATKVPQSRAS